MLTVIINASGETESDLLDSVDEARRSIEGTPTTRGSLPRTSSQPGRRCAANDSR